MEAQLMKWDTNFKNYQLLFRYYWLITIGLILFVILLDLSFNYFQKTQSKPISPWITAHFNWIEYKLNKNDAIEDQIHQLSHLSKLPVYFLQKENVIFSESPSERIQETFNEEGLSVYYKFSKTLDGIIQLGPLKEKTISSFDWSNWIPLLFYLGLFFLLFFLLKPLIHDLNILSKSAESFASDYRKPLTLLPKIKMLHYLGHSFSLMSQKIRDLIQSQNELTGALSHEMRTPLARLKYALAVVDKNHPEDIQKSLCSIQQDIQEIDQLVITLLDYARLDHPDMKLNVQSVPIQDWLEAIIKKFSEPSIKIQLHIKNSVHTVHLDPYLMEIIINNLMANAIRYAKQSIHLYFEQTTENNRLSLEDDGPGIPEDQREHIFKAFTRLDDSRHRDTGGYGLGLAIVSRIALLHTGHVTANKSRLGGTAITIIWPV